MPGGNVFDNARSGFRTEQEVAIETIFPAKNKFQMLQMITEYQPRSIVPWSVLGIFRREYHSKTLEIFQEECNTNNIARERQGRLEAQAIYSRPKFHEEGKEGSVE